MTGVLSELHITGLGVIDDAVLEPHPGLTAVTGETGAGKTMVVTALGLITGGRADSGRVRVGADRAIVEARMVVAAGHPLAGQVEAAGGHLDDDGSVILIRSVAADGRSRAHVGGRAAPVGVLAELTEPLVTVHGQSDAIILLQPAQQRAVLDRFGHHESQLAEYRRARTAWLAAVAELADRTVHARERGLREQSLRLGIAEIDRVAPQPDEDVELIAEVRRLENADSLRGAAATAGQALSGGDDAPDTPSAVDLVELARKVLEGSGDQRLVDWGTALHQTSAVLVDISAELSDYLQDLDADPARFEQALTRQGELRTLTRRYGADVNEVLAWRAEAVRELDGLDSSEAALASLRSLCGRLAGDTAAAAAGLSARRRIAAAQLSARATAELADLAMGRATLRVAVTARPAATGAGESLDIDGRPVAAGVDGVDTVEFLMTAHPSAPELPIARGASGGELSRVMLAIEVVLAGADPVGTLVFDEVDAGVGGRAASEIGRRLARLARSHQVIVVTHLAQVAAFADRQVVVDAGSDGSVRSSSLRTVAADEREAELARMLGGTDGATARAHAAELLASAVTVADSRSPVSRSDAGSGNRRRSSPPRSGRDGQSSESSAPGSAH